MTLLMTVLKLPHILRHTSVNKHALQANDHFAFRGFATLGHSRIAVVAIAFPVRLTRNQ